MPSHQAEDHESEATDSRLRPSGYEFPPCVPSSVVWFGWVTPREPRTQLHYPLMRIGGISSVSVRSTRVRHRGSPSRREFEGSQFRRLFWYL